MATVTEERYREAFKRAVEGNIDHYHGVLYDVLGFKSLEELRAYADKTGFDVAVAAELEFMEGDF